MPICNKCNISFPNNITIDGKRRNLQRRKFCLTCSPFGLHNTKDITSQNDLSSKFCPRCQNDLPGNKFYSRRDGKGLSSYCKKCSNSQAVERQQEFKRQCVEYKGGSCVRCGYNKYIGCLHFHHLDPNQKDFDISYARSWKIENTISELDKCILVCSNCHGEIHAEQKGLL